MKVIYVNIEYIFNGENFTYDADLDDFINDLNTAQICKLASEIYDSEFMDNELKHNVEVEFNCISSDFFRDYEDENVIDCAKYIIHEIDEDVIVFFLEDTIKTFYEGRAREQYDDSKMNPYDYNGVKSTDF